MIRLLKHLRWIDLFIFVFATGLIVFQVWLDLRLISYTKDITMLIAQPNADMIEVWKNGGLMLACALGSTVSAIVVGYFVAKTAVHYGKNLRKALFKKVSEFSMTEINRFSTASLITRSTNDTSQIQRAISIGLQVFIKAPIMAIWTITKILDKSWQWSAATAAGVAFLLVMVLVIVVFALPKFKKIQGLVDDVNKTARENITGVRVVRAYNAEKYQQEKFEKVNKELTGTNMFVGRIMSLISPVMTLLMSGLSLAIFWIGAAIINNAQSVVVRLDLYSDMLVFSSYAMQVIMAFIMLIMVFIMLPKTIVSGKRINEVLKVVPIIKSGNLDISTVQTAGEVEFKNVSFKYPDAEEYIIQNVSFKANKGEVVAFIGSTGSGKSTLINLIPRFYDVTEGEILVNGHNVKDFKLRDLYNLIGYVPQQGVMFSGSVKENVNYGKIQTNDSMDNIKDAVDIAQAKDFVEKLEDTYDHQVAQGGTNLSGGQKQRLSIARAIAKQPEIFIFDDTFSALDYKTDALLRDALKRNLKNTTSLIVAQRIGTIKNADKIIVLDAGNVVGIGKHNDLLKTCAVYKEIALSQFSKKELTNE